MAAIVNKVYWNRRVHAVDCIMGNQGNMAENSKVCMEIQSKDFINQRNKFMF